MTGENTAAQEQTTTIINGNQMIANKPEEQLLAEIMDMQRQNLTAKKAEKIEDSKIFFSRCFIALAYAFFCLYCNQLRTYTPKKRKILSKLILAKAKPRAKLQVLLYFIPIFGWLYLATNFNSLNYCCSYKKLQKMCGEDFISHEILDKALNRDYESSW